MTGGGGSRIRMVSSQSVSQAQRRRATDFEGTPDSWTSIPACDFACLDAFVAGWGKTARLP